MIASVGFFLCGNLCVYSCMHDVYVCMYIAICMYMYGCMYVYLYSFIRSFIQVISTAPLQVRYYSEALPTQHGYCAGVSRRSATGNCEWRTCPWSLGGG